MNKSAFVREIDFQELEPKVNTYLHPRSNSGCMLNIISAFSPEALLNLGTIYLLAVVPYFE